MTKVVAIDAGHGRNTAGKRTPAGEREWSFNDVVVRAVIAELGKYEGVKTVRLDDPSGNTDVALSTRTKRANDAKADVLVSVHHNANTGRWGSWTGSETYSFPKSTQGLRLAKAVHPKVVSAYKLRDRGLKTANFHMLRKSRMPAILIEGGFMDSTIDIVKLRDNKVLTQAGKNIAQGIAEYLGLRKNPAPKPVPKPAPKKTGGKLYKVQIGAYSNKANAEAQAAKAKKAGFNTYIVHE